MAHSPSLPGDPPGTWRDAMGGLRDASGRTITNPNGSDASTTGNGNLAGAGSAVSGWLFGGNATKGMANGPQTADYQRGYLQNFANRQAPQMGVPSAGQSNATAGQQNQLAQMLFKTASGQAPGPGELAVQRGINQAQAAQTSQAQMARGADAMLAGRNAARNSVDIGVSGAGQRGIAQMQDVNNAQAGLAGLLGMQRSQDLSQRGQDIGVQQGNQQAQMQQQQLQLGALAQMLGVDTATLQQDLAKRNINLQDKGMFPTLLQIGGQIGAASATGGAA